MQFSRTGHISPTGLQDWFKRINAAMCVAWILGSVPGHVSVPGSRHGESEMVMV